MSNVQQTADGVGGIILPLLLCGIVGCGADASKGVEVAPATESLRSLTTAYSFATQSLGRPPRNAEEIKPFLAKHGDAAALLKSPTDGTDLVIQWGTDLLKPQDEKFPVWAYEKNAHNGKRWVIQGRRPVEMSDEELRSVPFARGMKKPF